MSFGRFKLINFWISSLVSRSLVDIRPQRRLWMYASRMYISWINGSGSMGSKKREPPSERVLALNKWSIDWECLDKRSVDFDHLERRSVDRKHFEVWSIEFQYSLYLLMTQDMFSKQDWTSFVKPSNSPADAEIVDCQKCSTEPIVSSSGEGSESIATESIQTPLVRNELQNWAFSEASSPVYFDR